MVAAGLTDAMLLFALTIPVVMQYRILPIDGTPYWLFGVLFFVLLVNAVISYSPLALGRYKKRADTIKNWLLVVALCISLGGATITAIADRARVAPVWGVHDIILQEEAAMRYIIRGKNPYAETYFGTPVESFNYDEPGNTDAVNPALYHFVMHPFYLMFPFVLYYSVRPLVGFFDARMASVFAMVLLLIAVWHWFRDKGIARVAVVLTALSPAVVSYFIEGRSDVFALSFLVCALVLLERKHYVLSAVAAVLAALSKQTVWFIGPFYLSVLFWLTAKHRAAFWKSLGVSLCVGLGIVLPFLIWDAPAFVNSVVLYVSGNTTHSYPVSGYGFGIVLTSLGYIRDIHTYYPFLYWQLGIGLPLFVVLWRWLRRNPAPSRLMMAYAVFLMVFWYFSRYFNNSHLGYLSMLFVLALTKRMDEGSV